MPNQERPESQSGTDHARRILRELGVPAGTMREEHRELEARFADAVGPLMDLLMDAEPKGEGVAHFAVRRLLAGAMNDLFASLHLLTHGYLSQAYNTLRAGYETLDLVELLATTQGEAERWEAPEEGHREFSPGAVRKRLGRESFDEVYSHFSESGHPRFRAAGLGAYGKRTEGSEQVSIVINIGPFLLDESPEQWFLAMFVTITVGLLCARIGRLVDLGGIEQPVWEAGALENQKALHEMTKLIADQLGGFGLDASRITEEYDSLWQAVEGGEAERSDIPS